MITPDEFKDLLDRHEAEFGDLKITLDVGTWRRELCRLEEKRPARHNWMHNDAKVELKKKIRAEFLRKFELKRYHGLGESFKIEQKLDHLFTLDHCEYFSKETRSGKAIVLVSQPYGYNRAKNEAAAAKLGAVFLDLEEWAWYYPYHANCFGILFPREVVVKMRADRAYFKRHGQTKEERDALKASLKAELAALRER